MLGLLKYPDDFYKAHGLNQLWIKDENTEPDQATNKGFDKRHDYIIRSSDPKGSFSFKIPLKHFLGFCEDYKKILYGMQQRLTLTRTGNDNIIFKGTKNVGGVVTAIEAGKVNIKRIRWFMPHVIPQMRTGYNLIKSLRKKKKYLWVIECYNVIAHRFQKIKQLLLGGLGSNHLQIYHVLL